MSFVKIANIIEAIQSSQNDQPVYSRYLQRVELAARSYCKQNNLNIEEHWFHEIQNGEIFPDKDKRGNALIKIGDQTMKWNDYVVSIFSFEKGKIEFPHPNDGMLFIHLRDYIDSAKYVGDSIYLQYLNNVMATGKLYCAQNKINLFKHIFHNNSKDSRILPNLITKGATKLVVAGKTYTWDQLTGSPAFLITNDNTAIIEAELAGLKTAEDLGANRFDSAIISIRELLHNTGEALDVIITGIRSDRPEDLDTQEMVSKVKNLKRTLVWE